MSFISNAFHSILNAGRDAALSAEEKKGREQAKQILEMVKVASIVVSATAAIFIFGLFPGPFTFLLTAAIGLIGREVYQISENTLEILEKTAVEIRVRQSTENLGNQLAKNLWVAAPLVRTGVIELEKQIKI